MPRKAPNPTDQYVGSRVRLRRQQLGISQEKLATGLDLSFQQIQKYEKGTNRMGASRLQEIANTLKVPVTYFFEGTPNVRGSSASFPEHMSPALVSEFIGSSECQVLARAFSRIRSPRVRRGIATLVEQIAIDAEGEASTDKQRSVRRK
jgi:transcriptional regulator with XRE-family HTH domain